MKKYIDADRLKAKINERKKSLRAGICGEVFTRKQKNEMLVASEELDRVNRIIDSLLKEMPDTRVKGCKDCWHNYHCPMPQEGYDFNPDTCPYNPDKREKL